MNADRIIVVENGQIVEQGSHDELIVSGGRYADLWSKQIFVRPKDDNKTKEDAVVQTGIVNDLSTEQTKTELSKVKPASTTKDVEEAGSKKKKGLGEGLLSTPKHTKDGSRLNPVAATFTPRSLGNSRQRPSIDISAGSEISSKTAAKSDDETKRLQWSDEVAALDETSARNPNTGDEAKPTQSDQGSNQAKMLGNAPKKLERHKAFNQAVNRALKGSRSDHQDPGVTEAVELKHPRYSRRVQSKSEPSHTSQDSEVAEKELFVLPDVTEEPASLAHRRVSAPPLKAATVLPSHIPKPPGNGHLANITRFTPVRGPPQPNDAKPTTVSSTLPGLTQLDKLPLCQKLSSGCHQETVPGHKPPTTTRSVDNKRTASGVENQPPSLDTEPALSNQRGANRGGRRGRASWSRGRRGRGGNRGASQSGADQA
ncbi:hypothetical protein G7046_g7889 [Stylonectria norvegica]|nr:hypothetical protein G7046_g7889 [Stylonectria norvegica]